MMMIEKFTKEIVVGVPVVIYDNNRDEVFVLMSK